MDDLPRPFLERMQRLLGGEYADFLASYERPAPCGLRVNTLKIAPERFCALAPFGLEPVPWSPEGYTITPAQSAGEAPGRHPYHAAGLYYLQEPCAMAAAEVLDPQPGERVLDLAAAPGGKATHLAARMQNRGLLIANEIHPRRVWDLAENLERCGARNAAITNEVPERLAARLEGFFDRVLVDAPCSGEGLFRKNPPARSQWKPEQVEGCAARQTAILEAAARLTRPGGRLVYATCTFSPQENEAVIARFLKIHPEFELLEPPRRPGFGEGRPDWVPGGAPDLLRRAIRIWPHRSEGEGHFLALLRREEANSPGAVKARNPYPPSRQALRLFRDFCRATLQAGLDELLLAQLGSYLYRLPEPFPAMESLRLIHPGWWLGVLKKDRLEPAHALALGLESEAALRRVDLAMSDPAPVYAYLRGENLAWKEEGVGWALVTVDGFPLGWGKVAAGRVKNDYPRGLRRP